MTCFKFVFFIFVFQKLLKEKWWVREKRVGGGAKYTVMEREATLGGGHIAQHTDDALHNCAQEPM